jgi:hypothetical protein
MMGGRPNAVTSRRIEATEPALHSLWADRVVIVDRLPEHASNPVDNT